MMRARLIPRITLLMASAWFAAASASAQSTATIQGAVSDTQGAVMPGVTVTIHNTATGIERSVVTSSAGEYVAASLPPGHYALVAHLEGFQDQKLEIDAGPRRRSRRTSVWASPRWRRTSRWLACRRSSRRRACRWDR